jgi:glycosyltransferase involved in cell wall biosynthesis
LPQFAWKPTVFTVDAGHYKGRVVDDMQDVKDTETIRIPFLRIPGMVFIVKLLFPLVIGIYIVLHRSKYDVTYLTGSPFHPFVLTVLISGILKIPSVLDFRDSWSFNHGFSGRQPAGYLEKLREWFFRRIEALSIRFSTRTVFATTTLEKEYAETYPRYMVKYATIPNGFDEEDFVNVRPQKITDKRSLVLTGKFNIYTPDVVTGFFEVLQDFSDLVFIYIGSEAREIAEIARKANASEKLIALPYKPYTEMCNIVAGADYAMLTTGLANGAGTKIFDYLALAKPTLCFVPKGSVITEMFPTNANLIIQEAPHTKESIREGIKKLLVAPAPVADASIKKYSRKKTSMELAHLLDNIIQPD